MTNDGILEENMEQNESELSELEETEELTEDGQGTTESVLEEEQGNDSSVSDGDSEATPVVPVTIEMDNEELLTELRLINQQMEAMQTYQEERDISLFEKELSNYNTTEGITLCLFLFVVAFFIMKLIGGIIKCEKE